MQQAGAPPKGIGSPQKGTQSLQVPQMGHGQGGGFSQLTSEEGNNANTQDTTGAKPIFTEAKTKGHIVIPYTQGLCKSIKKICNKYSIQTHFKCNRTIQTSWFPLRIKTPWKTKVWPSIGSNVENLHVMRNV